VGKIVVKAVCGSVFSAMWHCILSAELTKTHYLEWLNLEKCLSALWKYSQDKGKLDTYYYEEKMNYLR